jgi:hypothetical protein
VPVTEATAAASLLRCVRDVAVPVPVGGRGTATLSRVPGQFVRTCARKHCTLGKGESVSHRGACLGTLTVTDDEHGGAVLLRVNVTTDLNPDFPNVRANRAALGPHLS